MKTAILTISVIFLLSLGTVFAGNDLESPGLNGSITESLLKTLTPVTPKEANFDEEFLPMDKNFTILPLIPAIPRTATFEDTLLPEMSMRELLQLLAPKSPNEVDFNDPLESINNLLQFRPVIPKEALFEDIK